MTFSNLQSAYNHIILYCTTASFFRTLIVIIHLSKCNFLSILVFTDTPWTSSPSPTTIPTIIPPPENPNHFLPLPQKATAPEIDFPSISGAAVSPYNHFLPIIPRRCSNTSPSHKPVTHSPAQTVTPLIRFKKQLLSRSNRTMARLQNLHCMFSFFFRQNIQQAADCFCHTTLILRENGRRNTEKLI